jgi:hypothetical protein
MHIAAAPAPQVIAVGRLVARGAAADVDDSAAAVPAASVRNISDEENKKTGSSLAQQCTRTLVAIGTAAFIKFHWPAPGDDALPVYGRDLTSTLS